MSIEEIKNKAYQRRHKDTSMVHITDVCLLLDELQAELQDCREKLNGTDAIKEDE